MSDPARIDPARAARWRDAAVEDIHEAAVVDVGSNSVRLVAYRLDGRAMTPFLNEKVMAGLGRNLARTGKLSPEGALEAIAALRRFRMLLSALGVTEIDAVATAAVREAADGADFVRRVERDVGVKLRVIDGAEEARLSALGVLAGEPEARGVVGDLGGSSLELVAVTPDGPGKGDTFPLGPLALMDDKFDAERIAAIADAALAKSSVLNGRGGIFYAVGGAWRALGRIDIVLRDHPIGVLHHHEMSRAEALKIADFVRKQSRRSLEKLEDSAAKRADSLPYAAVILERVLKRGGFSRVILSSYGLREGLLYEHLSARSRAEHPLVAAASSFGAPTQRAREFGAALEKWIAPLFESLPPAFERGRDRILRAAAARLADLGATFHPDQRDELMFDLVLRAPFAAVNHPERTFLAAAIHHRYTKAEPGNSAAYERLLSEEQRAASAALGAALRLGADISGRATALLEDFALEADGATVTLSYKANRAHLVTDQATKRLQPLADILGLRAQIVSGLRR
jgi:exopolyphosphatase/guanosine-5'-triphosphate,3'-diphosphate pyrophosphatase